MNVVPVKAFTDNFIWLIAGARDAVAVDPGEAAPLLAELKTRQLSLKAVLITHHHDDHSGGLPELQQVFPGLRVYGAAAEAESITGLTHPLQGGEVLDFPEVGARFRVIPVPGHTRGHLAYLAGEALFCGDTLFGCGCGRLFEGTPAQMAASLDTLAALPATTRVYCAHEYTALNLPFALQVDPDNVELQARARRVAEQLARGEGTVPLSLGEELATNPFLRCREPALIAAAGLTAGQLDPVSVFTALRAQRDVFRAR